MIQLNRIGENTLVFRNEPRIVGTASVVGPKEGEGPMGNTFDMVLPDARFGEDSYEQAEHKIFQEACRLALKKANIPPSQVQALLGGDLLNQIMAASLSARELRIPFLGLYGACSTMAESLLIGSILVDGGYCAPVVCAAGSHFCTAERQYRFPLEYASQRTPTAQWTVTGSGACVLNTQGDATAKITMATIGRVVDMGVTDANNMGAAMAPAAASTIMRHLTDTNRTPDDFDCLITGDLGQVGSELLYELLRKNDVPLGPKKHMDCGLSMFSASQDVHAGGSGCGCSASLLSSYILPRIKAGSWKRVLFMATGALLSPTTSQQGESIPGVAHALVIEGV